MRWLRPDAAIEIESPIDDVWKMLMDLAHMDLWLEDVHDARLVSDDLAVDALVEAQLDGGEPKLVRFQVTRLQFPHWFALRVAEGPFPYEVEVELLPVGANTRMWLRRRIGAQGALRSGIVTVARVAMELSQSRRMTKQLEAFKAEVEARMRVTGETAPGARDA